MPWVRNICIMVCSQTRIKLSFHNATNNYHYLSIEAENLVFQITASRSAEEPPSIRVKFDNGVEDDMELVHYKMNKNSVVGCNYLGRLTTQPSSSSVAVTGCLNNPGDTMDVTIISQYNINKMFSVDVDGHAEVIKNPFEDGGKTII